MSAVLRWTFLRLPDGRFAGFEAAGHAPGARGQSLLCASVTTLAQTLLLGLQTAIGLPLAVTVAEDGYLSCRIAAREADAETAIAVLFRTAELGLEYLGTAAPDGAALAVQYRTLDEGVRDGS